MLVVLALGVLELAADSLHLVLVLVDLRRANHDGAKRPREASSGSPLRLVLCASTASHYDVSRALDPRGIMFHNHQEEGGAFLMNTVHGSLLF